MFVLNKSDEMRVLNRKVEGFTLLEVMVAMAIIAIAMTAVLSLQSQSISLASEAKFSTTAALLAQNKMAETEWGNRLDLSSDSGDFEEDFPGYTWQVKVEDVSMDLPENVSNHLKEMTVIISWGEEGVYRYQLKAYRFLPEKPL
jgi:general secretion pathway protein I